MLALFGGVRVPAAATVEHLRPSEKERRRGLPGASRATRDAARCAWTEVEVYEAFVETGEIVDAKLE